MTTENPTFIKAFKTASKYWHMACNYDRVNPDSVEVTLSEGNPHRKNYYRALQDLDRVINDMPITENPCL
jgi:hypothetical protein